MIVNRTVSERLLLVNLGFQVDPQRIRVRKSCNIWVIRGCPISFVSVPDPEFPRMVDTIAWLFKQPHKKS